MEKNESRESVSTVASKARGKLTATRRNGIREPKTLEQASSNTEIVMEQVGTNVHSLSAATVVEKRVT